MCHLGCSVYGRASVLPERVSAETLTVMDLCLGKEIPSSNLHTYLLGEWIEV